jgi:hypothetical protein
MDVAKRKSPVTGSSFPPLSPEYKKEKQEDGYQGVPDLQRSGDMLDSLDYRITPEGIEIGIYGEAAPRADGHNNLSGDSDLPERQFLPKAGESFRPAITAEVEKILVDSMEMPDLSGVTSSSELYDIVAATLGLNTRAETRNAILRKPMLFNLISEKGLLDLL